MFKEKFLDRPINVLLLVGALIHHSTHLFYGISLIVSISFDASLGDIFGPSYCQFELYIATFGVGYLSIGSLGIAIYHVLYIRCHHWAKYVVGERLLLGTILVGSLALTAVLSALFIIETSSKRVAFNGCTGNSKLAQSILIEYQQSQGMLGPFYHWSEHTSPC